MQQTEKYKFNIIETSDAFGPDALNANARTAEAQLAALDAREAADKAALEKTDAANKTALEKALADQKAALEKTDAANKAALEKALADQKAALEKALADQKAALQSAIGTAGKTCRVATGTYVGSGVIGQNSANSLTFDFTPLVVFIGSATHGYGQILMWPSIVSCNFTNVSVSVKWGTKSVSWYIGNGDSRYIEDQCNVNGVTYSYTAFGVSG